MVLGIIVWLRVDGFYRRGKSAVRLERLMINQPMTIETIDEEKKTEPLFQTFKTIGGYIGFILIYRVQVVLSSFPVYLHL